MLRNADSKQHMSQREGAAVCLTQFLSLNSIEDPSAEAWAWLFLRDSSQMHASSCQKKPNPSSIKHTSIFIYWNSIDPMKHQDTEHQPGTNSGKQDLCNKTHCSSWVRPLPAGQVAEQNGTWNSPQSTTGNTALSHQDIPSLPSRQCPSYLSWFSVVSWHSTRQRLPMTPQSKKAVWANSVFPQSSPKRNCWNGVGISLVIHKVNQDLQTKKYVWLRLVP